MEMVQDKQNRPLICSKRIEACKVSQENYPYANVNKKKNKKKKKEDTDPSTWLNHALLVVHCKGSILSLVSMANGLVAAEHTVGLVEKPYGMFRYDGTQF